MQVFASATREKTTKFLLSYHHQRNPPFFGLFAQTFLKTSLASCREIMILTTFGHNAMIAKLRRLRHRVMVRTKLRVPLVWLRHRGLAPNDIFLASYPRSGNTWARFLLSEVLTGISANFQNIDRTVAEMGIHLRARSVLPGGGRCVKTHEHYRREYRRAIYLVRDIRDVVLSEFAIERQVQLHCMSFDEYLLRFLAGETQGFGSWQKHVSNWTNCPLARSGDLLVVKFEELRRDPENVLAYMAAFIGCAPDAERVQQAVRNNSIAAMRAREDEAPNLPKNTPEEGRFVRSGNVGGWRSVLTPLQRQLVNQYAGDVLASMGYERGYPTSVEHEVTPTSTNSEDILLPRSTCDLPS